MIRKIKYDVTFIGVKKRKTFLITFVNQKQGVNRI